MVQWLIICGVLGFCYGVRGVLAKCFFFFFFYLILV